MRSSILVRPWILALTFGFLELLGVTTWSAAAVVRCADTKTTTTCSQRPLHRKLVKSAPFQILLNSKRFTAKSADMLSSVGLFAHALYDLEITSVPSQRVTELTSVPVGFSFKMQAAPLATIGSIYICSAFPAANLPCYEIKTPQNNQLYTGTIQATAPWAAQQAPLHIVAIATGQIVGEFYEPSYIADATKKIESAATYTLSFDGFTLQDTRSNKTDTVWLNLQGLVTATPPDITASQNACKYVGEQWCLNGSYLENAHNSNYHPVAGRQVSSFRLTPEKENDLRVLFYLYNMGHDSRFAIANSVLNALSDIGQVVLELYSTAEGAGSSGGTAAKDLNNYIQQLNGAMTATCDGPLALDVAIFNNQSVDGSNLDTLDNLTRGSGIFSYTPDFVYRYKDGDFICDHRGSAYTVTLSAHRTSWRDWDELP